MEADKVFTHVVSGNQVTAYLKVGTKLVISTEDPGKSLPIDIICSSYSKKLASLDIQKKTLKPVIDIGSSCSIHTDTPETTTTVPLLRGILPGIDKVGVTKSLYVVCLYI